MAFEANRKSIYDLLNDISYVVPINQRKYVWNQNNWSELLDDVQDIIANGLNKQHFLGSIVLNKIDIPDDYIKNHFSIVDGQQRMITITLALIAIGQLLGELEDYKSFNGLTKNLVVVNSKGESSPIISNKANADVCKLVRNLIRNNKTSESSKMPLVSINNLIKESCESKKIAECLTFFYNSFNRITNSNLVEIEKFKNAILEINYINIEADQQEDAYSIFEALNARGQPLDDFDLLSNYILRFYSGKEEKELVKDVLNTIRVLSDNVELFLKHYVIHKYGKKFDKDENRPYKIIIKNEKNKDKPAFLSDLLCKAKYYNKIITYDFGCSGLEKKIFSFFKPRRQQQFRPIVLGLMHQLELGAIDQKTYDEALSFLYKFFVYYNVIGEQTSNKIEDIVYKYSYLLENRFNDNTISEMRQSMSERIPDDKEALLNHLKNLRYSNQIKAYSGSKKSENIRAVLEILEKEKGCTVDFNQFNLNLEHILPDDGAYENANIGNIMILEKELNESCGNENLEKKSQYYLQSQLITPQAVAKNYNNFDINKRLKEMTDQLYNLISSLKN